MYIAFRKNRRDLAKLMYSMGTFTADELVSRFREEKHGKDVSIDGEETIPAYLKHLAEIGVLALVNGKYYVDPAQLSGAPRKR